jgi:hypothetical protein
LSLTFGIDWFGELPQSGQGIWYMNVSLVAKLI